MSRDLPPTLVEELKRIQRMHRYFLRLISDGRNEPTIRVYIMPENKYIEATSIAEVELLLRDIFIGNDPLQDMHRRLRNWFDNPNKVLLFCTNGARDRCCAKFGFAVYKEAARLRDNEHFHFDVYQCTHLTGDRFAACALALPSGDLYGWLRRENIGEFLNDVARDRIHFPLFRGNSFLSESDQIIHGLISKRQQSTNSKDRWEVEQKGSWTSADPMIADIFAASPGDSRQVGSIVIETRDYESTDGCRDLDSGKKDTVPRLTVVNENWF